MWELHWTVEVFPPYLHGYSSFRESVPTIAWLVLAGYSRYPGESSPACLRDPNAYRSQHYYFLLACLRSPSARILHRRRSCLQVRPPLNRPTIPFSYLPLAMIPTGACASARKGRNAWIAQGTRPSLSNPPMSPMKPPPIPGRITPKIPPPARPSPPTSPGKHVPTPPTIRRLPPHRPLEGIPSACPSITRKSAP